MNQPQRGAAWPFTAVLSAELGQIASRRKRLGEEAGENAEDKAPPPENHETPDNKVGAAAVAPAEEISASVERPYPGRWPKTKQEAAEFRERLATAKGTSEPDRDEGPTSIEQANHLGLFGLAFSGGGIRSATFNLGVLQGLAKRRLLRKFDYLSTISGGGYIGSWLVAWIRRRGMAEVEQHLGEPRAKQPGFREPPEIRFLREYSNYLTPRKGLLGVDTWTGLAIYLRNLILNQLVLILFIAAVMLLPRVLAAFAQVHKNSFEANSYCWLAAFIICIPGVVGVAANMRCYSMDVQDRVLARIKGERQKSNRISAELIYPDKEKGKKLFDSHPPIEIWNSTITERRLLDKETRITGFDAKSNRLRFSEEVEVEDGDLVIATYEPVSDGKWVSILVTLPTFLGAALLSCVLAVTDMSRWQIFEMDFNRPTTWAAAGAFGLLSVWLAAFLLIRWNLDISERGKARKTITWISIFASPFIAGAAGGLLLWSMIPSLRCWGKECAGMWKVLGFGTPIIALILLGFTVLQIGILGSAFADPRREWWGRLAATLMICCFVWAAAFALAGYSPLLLLWLFHFKKSAWLTGLGWAATTGLGIIGGKSSKTGGPDSIPWKEYALSVTPYVFVVGLLMLVSLGVHASLLKAQGLKVMATEGKNVVLNFSGSLEEFPNKPPDGDFKWKLKQERVVSMSEHDYWETVEKSFDCWLILVALAGFAEGADGVLVRSILPAPPSAMSALTGGAADGMAEVGGAPAFAVDGAAAVSGTGIAAGRVAWFRSDGTSVGLACPPTSATIGTGSGSPTGAAFLSASACLVLSVASISSILCTTSWRLGALGCSRRKLR